MFETGNFVDIRFQDQPRYLQPAGIYWLQAISVSLLSAPGDHDAWAYRVPSLIGATIAVLLTAWIGNLLFGAPTGFLQGNNITLKVKKEASGAKTIGFTSL
jgi:4-amino-4-deoxy-L-arabinose transferase-like glycosyltransferase